MKVWIEIDRCTGAGLCEMIEQQVFALGEGFETAADPWSGDRRS